MIIFDLQQARASSHILTVRCHYTCYLLRLESRSPSFNWLVLLPSCSHIRNKWYWLYKCRNRESIRPFTSEVGSKTLSLCIHYRVVKSEALSITTRGNASFLSGIIWQPNHYFWQIVFAGTYFSHSVGVGEVRLLVMCVTPLHTIFFLCMFRTLAMSW
jgi:hypothetical protein